MGDYLGFVNAQLHNVSSDFVDALCAAAMRAKNAELITVILGSDIQQSDLDDATDALQTMFPNAELLLIDGHQEVWSLLVGIE